MVRRRHMCRMHSLRGTDGDRGAAAVEFALVVVPLLMIIWGLISYGIMFSYREALSQAAGEGARAAVAAPTASITAAATGAIGSALGSYGQTCSTALGAALTCNVSAPTSGGSCPTGHTCVTVTVTYLYRDNPIIPNVPGFGIVLPQTLSFTQTVEVS